MGRAESQGAASARLDWEELVTDGHVRAARLRWIQPLLLAAGVACIVLGLALFFAVKAPTDTGGPRQVGSDEVERAQAPVEAAMSGMPRLQRLPDDGQALPLFDPIGKVVLPKLLAGLTASGKLGTEDVPVENIPIDSFWRQPWPRGKIVSTGQGDVRLVGVTVNTGTADYPSTTRWIGVFSKRAGAWKFASLEAPGLQSINGQQSVSPLTIPLTLRSVVPRYDPPKDLGSDQTGIR